nr:MAG TPA: hypothetical protein [Caudoviricetes sp.]
MSCAYYIETCQPEPKGSFYIVRHRTERRKP